MIIFHNMLNVMNEMFLNNYEKGLTLDKQVSVLSPVKIFLL